MLLPSPPEDYDFVHNPSHASGANPSYPPHDHQSVSIGTNMNMDIEIGDCYTDTGFAAYTDPGMGIIPDEKDQTVCGDQCSSDIENSQGPERGPENDAPLNFPSLTVTADDIRKAAKDVRRLTLGGLQQVTPWHLKRAILGSSSEGCATAAAHLSTRWCTGDYPLLLGELAAESKLIALFKDERKEDVRAISIGLPRKETADESLLQQNPNRNHTDSFPIPPGGNQRWVRNWRPRHASTCTTSRNKRRRNPSSRF